MKQSNFYIVKQLCKQNSMSIELCDFLVLRTRGNYLIITEDEFVEEVAPLAEWKRMKGLTTRTLRFPMLVARIPVVTPDEWYSRVSLVSDSGYFENTSNRIYSFLSERGYAVDRFYFCEPCHYKRLDTSQGRIS